jgi:hypothetical protein
VLLSLQEEEEERSDRWKNFLDRQAEDGESSGEELLARMPRMAGQSQDHIKSKYGLKSGPPWAILRR